MQTGEIKSIKYKNGNVYGGKIDDNKPHGKGVIKYKNGNVYGGNIDNNKPHGKGVMTNAKGKMIYAGEFTHGKPHGNGLITFADGNMYEVICRGGDVLNGKGVMEFTNGDFYTGKFKDGVPHDKSGCFEYDDKSHIRRYFGEVQDGKPHGQGVMTETDGTKYEGNFKDGERDGKGILTYQNGTKYEGNFKGDLQCGQGVMTYPWGGSESGEYRYGSLNGKGVRKYANGDSYEGEFFVGKRHGQGVYTYANGDVTKYNGKWYNGEYHGQGEMAYSNGTKYNGEFKDGRMFVDVKKPKKQNETKTVVFQSSQLEKAENAQWGHGRFIDQNHLITRYNDINDANEVIGKLNELADVNGCASTKFKVVFDQHGGEQGLNDITVDTESAKQMLQMLYKKGYRDITVSDLSCHGATGYHFKGISQEFVNTNPDINVTIRASAEDRVVSSCHSNNGTKFRTFSTDGQALNREKSVYKSNLTQIVGGNTNEESKESSLLHKNTTMKNASIQR